MAEPSTNRLAALRRLVRHGLLQPRILARREAGWPHLLMSWGFLGLFVGSLLLQLELHALAPWGLVEPRGVFYQTVQGMLDLFGAALVVGAALALDRRLRRPPPHLPGGREVQPLLWALLFLGASGFLLEGLRMLLEPRPAQVWAFGGQAVAALLAAVPWSRASALAVYDALYGIHAVVTFALLAAIPFTFLRHTLTAPFHLLLTPPRPRGALPTPFKLEELLASGSFDVKVGAATLGDFTWQERWALKACTDCGRCQDACPAYATGTALSPRALVRKLYRAGDGNGTRELVPDVVSEDELWACTLCGACSEACPVLIRPLDYVVPMRRELVTRNRLGRRATEMLSHLTRASNPFGPPQAERAELARELGAPLLSDRPDADVLYWIGCAATYHPRARRVAMAMVRILEAAEVSYAILGGEERCSGDPARRLGEEGKFQELALANIATLERYGVRRVLTHCAHCFNTFTHEYPELGARFETTHHAHFLRELVASGRIAPRRELDARVCLHDACYLARMNGAAEAPRALLDALPGVARVEMAASREASFCCGAGGANYWYEVPRRERMCEPRARQAVATGAAVVAVECPYCLSMLESSTAALDGRLAVRDVAELVAEALG